MSGLDWQQVTDALTAAVDGLDLQVVAAPDLGGARVTGPRVEAYLVPTGSGVNVECWRQAAGNPYKIVTVEGLDEAVRLALAEVSRGVTPHHHRED